MEELKTLRVIAADRMDGALIISFSDGRCGLYTADLLYATLAAARELDEVTIDDPKQMEVN